MYRYFFESGGGEGGSGLSLRICQIPWGLATPPPSPGPNPSYTSVLRKNNLEFWKKHIKKQSNCEV